MYITLAVLCEHEVSYRSENDAAIPNEVSALSALLAFTRTALVLVLQVNAV